MGDLLIRGIPDPLKRDFDGLGLKLVNPFEAPA